MAKPAARARTKSPPRARPAGPAQPHSTSPLRPSSKPPLWQSPSESSSSATLSPGDHLKMLIELLQPLGPELVRRWVATLLLVDRDEREAMLAMVEAHVAAHYSAPLASLEPPPSTLEDGV